MRRSISNGSFRWERCSHNRWRQQSSLYNFRVNSVHPGTIRTPMTENENVRELVKEIEKDIPMKRIAEPEETSKLVLYLSADESSYSTGTEFVADGGLIQVM